MKRWLSACMTLLAFVALDTAGNGYRPATAAPAVTSAVAGVSVVNAVTGTPILGVSPLTAGSVVDLTRLPTRRLRLRVTLAAGVAAGSVRLTVDGDTGVDNALPYDFPFAAGAGSHRLTVWAYHGPDASGGLVHAPVTLAFGVSATPVVTPPLDVLFVGNSLIGTTTRATGEDTPAVLRRLAAAEGRSLRYRAVIRFGSTLRRTWDAGAVREALDGTRKWDYIVLQEFSTLVARNVAAASDTLMNRYAPTFTQALKPGGRVVLIKNWALVDPAPFRTRALNVAAIDAHYARLSAGLPAPNVVAPIGSEFETVIRARGAGMLIVPDGKHPTDLATYLDAVTLYGILFRTSPRALDDLYVRPADAAYLRGVAARAIGY